MCISEGKNGDEVSATYLKVISIITAHISAKSTSLCPLLADQGSDKSPLS